MSDHIQITVEGVNKVGINAICVVPVCQSSQFSNTMHVHILTHSMLLQCLYTFEHIIVEILYSVYNRNFLRW